MIPKLSQKDDQWHRKANSELIRVTLKLFRDRIYEYSIRYSRKRLGLYQNTEKPDNLLSVLEEIRDRNKLPLDTADYNHVARWGGNCVAKSLSTATCGLS